MIGQIVLAFLLFFLPTQLGRHFWPKEAFLFGLKVDFLSPTFYLQDCFFLLLFIPWLIRNFPKIIPRRGAEKKYIIISLLGASCLAFNIIVSPTPLVSFFIWLRVSELLCLGAIAASRASLVWFFLERILPLTVLGEFFLGLAQVVRQASVGGPFWLLGERSFNIFTPGIARAALLGKVVLRPYGTFSHPNSLAGFILVSSILILGKKRLNLLDQAALAAGFFLILLSFSRTVWLAAFLLGLIYFVARLWKSFLAKKFVLTFTYLGTALFLPLILFAFSRTAIDPSSFLVREDLARAALLLIKSSPLFGVGAGGFIVRLSQIQPVWSSLAWRQPVHNIFLLIWAETGLIGLSAFLALFILAGRRLWDRLDAYRSWSLIAALAAILFTGLFDHYWLTLIQNQLLLAVVLGLCFAVRRPPASFPGGRLNGRMK